MDFYDIYLEHVGQVDPDEPATEGQLQYLESLIYEGRLWAPKQLYQQFAFLKANMTFEQAQSFIALLKGFEMEPVNPTMKEIGLQVERRANREP